MISHHNVKHISKAYNKQIFEEKWKTTQYQFVDWSSPHLITEYLGYMLNFTWDTCSPLQEFGYMYIFILLLLTKVKDPNAHIIYDF